MILVERKTTTARLPYRGSLYAAGYDLSSDEEVTVHPGQRCAVRTGLAFAIPPGYYIQLLSRSGLALHQGISVQGGVIDSDYRGEVYVILFNLGDTSVQVSLGMRIVQAIILSVEHPGIVDVKVSDAVYLSLFFSS